MTLIYDIETWAYGQFDTTKDKFRTIAMYELESDKEHFYTYHQLTEIKELFRKHKIIVGFNNWHYDDPILKRAGVSLKYHNNIDLREVAKKRGEYIGLDNTSLSLANIAKHLNLSEFKDEEFDYDILKKDEWTDEELAYIEVYNIQDIKVTAALFRKFHEYFTPFKEFVSKADQDNLSWLKSSVATYTYKVMCHQTGIKEEYDDKTTRKPFKGGFVAEPTVGEAHGNIYCLDFNSLYPHMYIMGNLSTPINTGGWARDLFFDLQGTYNNTGMGVKESVLHMLYKKRVGFKKVKNPLEYAIKIVMNTFYGVTGNPVFKNLYNYKTASDCTAMGRKCIKYTKQIFEAYGYKFLYTDTDSVYIQDPFKDEPSMMAVKDRVIAFLKTKVPFPVDTFDLGIDYRIKHIWFFKTGEHYKKKNYMLVTEENELIIKGLPMIKRDGSGIGLYIFNKYMRDNIINGTIQHSYPEIRKIVYDEIDKDLSLVARKFIVGTPDSYKQKNQLQAVIARKYGAGKHILIPNKYYGVGQSVKYCTEEEFRAKDFNMHSIILNKMWNELQEFLNYKPDATTTKNHKAQMDLLAWTNC